VARKYRAYRASEGVYERALLVPDRQGTIAWSYCSPIAVNPGADGILDASKGFQIRQELMAKLFIGGIRSGVNGTPTLASGMMVPMTTPPWWRESGCVPLQIRSHDVRRSAPINVTIR
jgi:hypothetical protein